MARVKAIFILLLGAMALPAAPAVPSFRNDVMAVLAKAGCNAGTCHGNANGKGGFKLSLRGEDLATDFLTLTRGQFGRRVDAIEPDHSLLLRKATGTVAHKGGQRFKPGSRDFQILRDWIATGMLNDTAIAPAVVRLQVQATRRIVRAPGKEIAITVRAFFANNTSRDVTAMAVYEPSNQNVEVNAGGIVRRKEFGESTVLVRFLEKQVPVPVAFIPARADFKWSQPTEMNYIDRHVFTKLQSMRLNPSGLCDDNAFIRRAYLDLLGFIPRGETVQAFVADSSRGKRQRLVEQLMKRPEFAEFWALKWSDLLRNEEKQLDRKGVHVFYQWLRRSFAENKPLNVMAREIIASRGSTYKNPPANFYRAHRTPVIRAENTAQVFLGVRLKCAQCHNHPFDRWTQDDYYDWTALFAGVDYKVLSNNRADRLDQHEFKGEQIVFLKPDETITNARTGKPAVHRLLGQGGAIASADKLGALADWVAAPDNPFFARVQANRIWYQLMGRGLVNPIDDFRPTNPASHPALLQALSEDFRKNEFDVRHLIRTIMASRAYQLSHEISGDNGDDTENYARAVPRRLEAEQLLDSLSAATGVWPKYANHPLGTRAGQLAGGYVPRRRKGEPPTDADHFLGMFGKPERLIACDCERSDDITLRQSFRTWCGPTMNNLIMDKNNYLKPLLASKQTDNQRVDTLFWRAIARPPNRKELAQIDKHFATAPEHRQAWEDLLWSLLNTKEFLFRW
tara:strand:+ start:1795 stop:4005 length:2211 start_codon:yes stop_codon:yes gene_type:complete